jgi:hypothetical protein
VLCFRSLVRALAVARRHPNAKFAYFTHSRRFGWAVPPLKRLLGARLRQIDTLEYNDIRHNGVSVFEGVGTGFWAFLDIARADLGIAEVARAIAARFGFSQRKTEEYCVEWLYQMSRLPMEMQELARCDSGGEYILVMRRSILAGSLSRFYASSAIEWYGPGLFGTPVVPRGAYAYDIETQKSYGLGAVNRAMALGLSIISMSVTSAAIAALRLVSIGVPPRPPGDGGARIAVYYTQPRYPGDGVSDLYWWPRSGIDPSRVLVLFKTDLPLAHRHALAADGFTAAHWATNPLALGRAMADFTRNRVPGFLICPRPTAVLGALGKCLALLRPRVVPAGLPTALRLIFMQLVFRVHWHSDLYRDLGVKLTWNLEDIERDKVVSAIALERIGGFKAGSHMSYAAFIEGHMNHVEDVFMTWGESSTRDLFRHYPNEARYVVGYPYADRPFSGLYRKGSPTTARIERDFAGKFRLGYMDQLHQNDLPTSIAAHKAIWHVFAQLLERHAELVILWKPTRPKNIVATLAPHVPALKRLMETGRVVIVEGEDTHGRARPYEVALACQLVVGLGLGTAAMETAVVGVPTFHFDFSDTSTNTFAAAGRDAVVFSTGAGLMAAIDATIEGRGDQAGQALYRIIDPFQDGNACRRTGLVMGWYLDAASQNMGRDEAHGWVRERAARSELFTIANQDDKECPQTRLSQ